MSGMLLIIAGSIMIVIALIGILILFLWERKQIRTLREKYREM